METAQKRMWQSMQGFFDVTMGGPLQLPQWILSKLRLKSWVLASLLMTGVPYLLLITPVFLNPPPGWISNGYWVSSLGYPLLILYLLLLQPVIQRFVTRIVNKLLPLLPGQYDSAELIAEGCITNRRSEVMAFLLGMVVGWVFGRFWLMPTVEMQIYSFAGSGATYGLLGWYIYSVLIYTRFLAGLHYQIHGLHVLRPSTLGPLFRWSVGISISIILATTINLPFIDQYRPLSISDYMIFSTVMLIVAMLFISSGISAPLQSQFRIIRALILFAIVILLGTLGYHRLEGWSMLDGLYMTIITMTTIGFSEANPLSAVGRVYTIVLSLIAIGVGGYAISSIAAFFVEGDFQHIIQRQKMDMQISNMRNHVVLCGAGRVGMRVAMEFHKTKTPFVVIEQDPEVLEELLRLGEIPHIEDDATEDEALRLAGIEHASGLVATLPDDKDNAFVVLSARSLNPNLKIVARLTHEENAEKMRKVGANEIVSTSTIGAMRMASMMLRPSVVAFLDEMMRVTGHTLRMEEIVVAQGSSFCNKTLAEADVGRQIGALVVAIRSEEKGYQFNPGAQTVLQGGDTLIIIGTPEQMTRVRQLDGHQL